MVVADRAADAAVSDLIPAREVVKVLRVVGRAQGVAAKALLAVGKVSQAADVQEVAREEINPAVVLVDAPVAGTVVAGVTAAVGHPSQ